MSDAPHVLVVDDKQSAHDTLESLLMREDYRLSFAFNGPEGLKMLDHELADAILLDVMMPGMDGFEACRRMKANPRTRHIPVILVTALDTTEDLARGFDAGADDFLHKPVNGIELRARVRSMLRIKRQYDELQTALRLRRELSSMLVHDIRKPLSSILALSEVLMMRTPPGEAPGEETAQIRAEVLQLNALLRDMVTLTSTDHHELDLNRQEADVGELLAAACADARALAASRTVDVHVGLQEPPVVASIDVRIMRTVFETLLTFSVRAAPVGSIIHVELRRAADDGRAFALSITDTGVTLDENVRRRLFESGTDGDAQMDAAHMAVDLSFCRSAVTAHGGTLVAEPNEPSGTTFVLSI